MTFEEHYFAMAREGLAAAEDLENGERPFGMLDHVATALASYLRTSAEGMERMWRMAILARDNTIPDEHIFPPMKEDE